MLAMRGVDAFCSQSNKGISERPTLNERLQILKVI